jgi:hypothetical protein
MIPLIEKNQWTKKWMGIGSVLDDAGVLHNKRQPSKSNTGNQKNAGVETRHCRVSKYLWLTVIVAYSKPFWLEYEKRAA